ncbi:Protein of unknown function [Pyronema omphalodes CBS 100304]|uniref:Uncharacterized protein n=1 Tax=Pyronema omphalodes (strain CBS 100304) TaxID=1076935 RepID=U4LUJ5_PYROM|nr:Protein of unknown function [Pyronema omphalodes CBS 100304]
MKHGDIDTSDVLCANALQGLSASIKKSTFNPQFYNLKLYGDLDSVMAFLLVDDVGLASVSTV